MTTIGIIGLGTVGSGVVELLRGQKDITIAKVCSRTKAKADALGVGDRWTAEYRAILDDPKISVVVELIGGFEPARTIIMDALSRGKHVVTANKAVLAEHGKEIFEAAAAHNAGIRFEAAVGGCIPIIRAITESFAAEHLTSIYGILNGTTNFMLTRMEEGKSYADALKEAQALGFAEADPSFDVEGRDASQKLAILAMLGFHADVNIPIFTWGITKLHRKDLRYAAELGYVIKLLAIGKNEQGIVELRVHPTMIPHDHILAGIRHEYNATFVAGKAIDSVLLSGKGAGKMPTASVVAGDILSLAAGAGTPIPALQAAVFRPMDSVRSRYYLRHEAIDKPGVVAQIATILGDHGISIKGVYQKEMDKEIVPIIILTHLAEEKALLSAVGLINKLPVVKEKTIIIRIEDLE